MSELGDLLELVYGAGDRWRTARLTMREWHHTGRTREAIERLQERQSGGGRMTMTMHAVGGPGPPEPEEVEHVVRTWIDGERAREERAGPYAFPTLGIRDGDRWWQYSERFGASANEAEPGVQSGIGEAALALLDPAHVLGALRLEPDGEIVVAERPALLVRGVPRDRDGFHPHRLGFGAEAYELVVDRERGVLLRTTSLLDEEPLSSTEVLEVAFDEDFPPDLFVFELPEGETFRPLFPRPEHVTLERAAELAPFTVLAPSEVPSDWQLHALYLPGEERPPQPPSVTLHYHSRDAGQQLNVAQTAADAEDQHVWLTWEEADGVRVAGPAEPHGLEPGYAQVERDGTRATLSSAELPRERIAALARSLRPLQPV